MKKYVVIDTNERYEELYYPEYTKELRENFGLFHLTEEEVEDLWLEYSDSRADAWLAPDKESVESVFNVQLRELRD